MLEKIVRKFSSISPSLLCCCIVLHLAIERTIAVVVLLSTFPNFSYPEGIRPALALLLLWGWVRPLIHPLLSAVTACNALLFSTDRLSPKHRKSFRNSAFFSQSVRFIM